MSGIKGKILSGVFWSSLQVIINQIFSFLVRLILAKLLFPEQFGVVGMATVIIGFVQVINDLGIGASLVQKRDADLREEHYHTAFWTGVLWAIFLYLLMAIVASGLVANFYDQPILKQLTPFLSLGILSSPVNLVHKARLTKAMEFKKMALIENTSSIVSGILSIMLAWLGFGIWSLAFNSVATIILAIPLYFRATAWKPQLIWSRDAFNEVFGFGIYTTGTNIVNYLMSNFDYLVIGKLVSAKALGAYAFAFVLTDTFRGRLMTIINKVMYPVYGKLQDDPGALKKYYLKTVNYNSLLIFPIMAFMVSLGDLFIIHIFGNKWSEAIDPLAILSLSVMIHMMVNSNTALIRGMGRPQLELILQIVKMVIFLPTLYIGIRYNGIVGAAWAVVINKVIAVIIAQYTFNRLLHIKISTLTFLTAVKNPWIASIIAYSSLYVIRTYTNFNFWVLSVLFFIVYVVSIWLLMGTELSSQLKDIKQSFKQRKGHVKSH
ncbi:lipopolysaccharide biosynthesis protein [Olivibacter sp. SDN3]|uniref:lipopolysaccharide biosynthesis protein n=1 Tax=Olivibacter sp. SDN3 TaxID=2764720 RepID=UPI0016519FEF|nr:lipopolysaccharide biosynthesis protein [Olivibacter sp. SDN3]QNL51595.1 lipopolysaccharide biosynthesis protein [Olivibacter sp. SDN3]